MQKLRFITCSGANEFTNVADLVALSEKFPMIEWGVQVSGKKYAFGSPRYRWVHCLDQYLRQGGKTLNLALHINSDWVDKFTTGDMPTEVLELLAKRDINKNPLFSRVQLNFKIGRDKEPDFELLMRRLRIYGVDRRFVLSYNKENKEFIHRLYSCGLREFDVLYDSSHGEGVSAKEWQAPAFFDEGILQGYAGGLSPDNVADELMAIRKVLPYDRSFYIDAEGRLKGDDRHLSLEKCEQYVVNALAAMCKI